MDWTKGRPRVGDTCWEVQWVYHRHVDEDGTGDPDRDREAFRLFATRAEAMAFAREVYPLDQYGAVRVTPLAYVPYDEGDAAEHPHAGYWEATRDSEYYEGE